MTNFELGWTAGIIDGEGCISIYRNGNSLFAPVVQVGACDEKMIEKLRSLWGGSVCHRRKKSKGGRTIWQWRVSSRSAAIFLQRIRSCLVVKLDQADIAIECAKYIPSPGKRSLVGAMEKREELSQQLRTLKRKVV